MPEGFPGVAYRCKPESEVLYDFMEKLPGALKPGGRVAILTFHSGEDKLVKKALKQGYKEGIYSGLFQRCDPTVCSGMRVRMTCQINEDALGDKA